jgi:hypothetical protein
MSRHRMVVVGFKLALALYAVSSVLTFQTPAFALGIYDVFMQASLSTSGPIPFGTSISFLPGIAFHNEVFSGNAVATGAALVSPPGTATALVSGFASGPGSSHAQSNAQAESQVSLFNANPTTVTFPLTFSHTRNLSLSSSNFEFTEVNARIAVILDNSDFLFSNFSDRIFASSFDSGSDTFSLALTPGSHSLLVFALADGSTSGSGFVSPTPEPVTLLLFGTTAAGLGVVRWRKRRRSPAHEHVT